MGDIKLKDLLGCIQTNQIITIKLGDTGEEFNPSIKKFVCYSEWYVIGIRARNGELWIMIKSEI